MLDEPVGGHEVGVEFQRPEGATQVGDRALVYIGEDVAVLRHLEEGADAERYARKRLEKLNEDPRIVPPSFLKPAAFSDAADQMEETKESLVCYPLR